MNESNNDNDRNLGLILLILGLIVAIAKVGNPSEKDNRFYVSWHRFLRNYFLKKIFIINNLKKNQSYYFNVEIDEFMRFFNKLPLKRKKRIIKYLETEIPEFKENNCSEFLLKRDIKNYKKTLKIFSYDSLIIHKQCFANIGFLIKIYHIFNERIRILIGKEKYQPTKNIIIDFIDIANQIQTIDNELIALIKTFTNDELYCHSDEIYDNLSELFYNRQFTNFINSFISNKKINLIKLPMPKGFDCECLRLIYMELSHEKYFELGSEDLFSKIFCGGIEEGVRIKWTSKFQYEFQFFVLAIYNEVSVHKIADIVKENVSKIFYYKDNKPLMLNHENGRETDKKRIDAKNKISSIINHFRQNVEKR